MTAHARLSHSTQGHAHGTRYRYLGEPIAFAVSVLFYVYSLSILLITTFVSLPNFSLMTKDIFVNA